MYFYKNYLLPLAQKLFHSFEIRVYDQGNNNYSILIGICGCSVDKLHLASLISEFMTELKGHVYILENTTWSRANEWPSF